VTRSWSCSLGGVILLTSLVLALPAGAQKASAADAAMAERLFEEARVLMAEKKYAEACPKLVASQKLDPGVGTLLNLGECFEKNGQTASAWAIYREAEARAEQEGQTPRAKFAGSRARALAPQVSRLTLHVSAGHRVPGLTISCDGRTIEESAWGTAIPLDPGAHTIEAKAPGYEPFTTKVDLDKASEKGLDVPALTLAVPPPPKKEEPSPPPSHEGTSMQTIAGYGLGGLGIAALAVGSVFGLQAFSTYGDADENHCTPRDCDAEGIALVDDAKRQALLSTVLFGAGAAFVVGAVVLVWTGRPARAARERGTLVTF
jgi:hypothetical protein